MKHINKTLFATTLLTSLLLAQPVLAGEKGPHGEFASHAATSLQSEITASKMKHAHKEQASRSETGNFSLKSNRVNYQLQEITSFDALASGRK